jgi:imidazolonepropionase-like amidohydrolase
MRMSRKGQRAAYIEILTDSDAGGTFVDHGLVALELEALTRLGLPREAIAAGTRNAARVIGLDHEIGTVEAGKRADRVVVDGDPPSSPDRARRAGPADGLIRPRRQPGCAARRDARSRPQPHRRA